ncbi:ATP-grasp fold amidoligase family protein [Sphingomonas faeni]|uniref:ATP-grasp fold amidoligase family protein n=1 Tax=Sphingomonas faeni TaxID=185950 RepID=UPI0033650D45
MIPSTTAPLSVTWPQTSYLADFGEKARPAPALAAWIRVHLTYWWRHRRRLSIDRPQRFTEFVQRRKLVDRDPRIPQMIDKVAVKPFVAAMLGTDWVTPTLWSGEILPDQIPFPGPFVVKSRHGCNQYRIVRDASDDWNAVRSAAAAWMQRSYGLWLDEWGYRNVPRGILIEPFVGEGPTLPVDYKLYVFHGRVEAIQVHVDRETCHRWVIFDRDWRGMSTDADRLNIHPPISLPLMIKGAEALGCGFAFVRVDFYDTGVIPRFGEMTFYPGSGLDPFDPPRLDELLGDHWCQVAGTDRTMT